MASFLRFFLVGSRGAGIRRLTGRQDFDLRASHACTLPRAALASVPFGFVLVRVRIGVYGVPWAGLEARLRVHITFVSGLFVVVVAR